MRLAQRTAGSARLQEMDPPQAQGSRRAQRPQERRPAGATTPKRRAYRRGRAEDARQKGALYLLILPPCRSPT